MNDFHFIIHDNISNNDIATFNDRDNAELFVEAKTKKEYKIALDYLNEGTIFTYNGKNRYSIREEI